MIPHYDNWIPVCCCWWQALHVDWPSLHCWPFHYCPCYGQHLPGQRLVWWVNFSHLTQLDPDLFHDPAAANLFKTLNSTILNGWLIIALTVCQYYSGIRVLFIVCSNTCDKMSNMPWLCACEWKWMLSTPCLSTAFKYLRVLHLMQMADVLQLLGILKHKSSIRSVQVITFFSAVWLASSGFVHVVRHDFW